MPIIFYQKGNYEIIENKKIYSIEDIKKMIDEKIEFKGDYLIGLEKNMVFFILENKKNKEKNREDNLNEKFYKLFNIKVYGDVILFFGNELELKQLIDLLISIDRANLLNKMNDELMKYVSRGGSSHIDNEYDNEEGDEKVYAIYDDIELYLKYLKGIYTYIDVEDILLDMIDFIYSDVNNMVDLIYNKNEKFLYRYKDTNVEIVINKENIIKIIDYVIDFYASKEDYDMCMNIKSNIKDLIEALGK